MDGENKNAVDSANHQDAESNENEVKVDANQLAQDNDADGALSPTAEIDNGNKEDHVDAPVTGDAVSVESTQTSQSTVDETSQDQPVSQQAAGENVSEENSSVEDSTEIVAGDQQLDQLSVGTSIEGDLDDEDLDAEWEGDAWDEDETDENASPLEEFVEEPVQAEVDSEMKWYILKVQVNRESSICDALQRRVKMAGMESMFGEVLVPTEDVREFTKSGRQRIVKRKLYPGYIVVRMIINDDTWFLVRETSGIGDFTGAVGKPAPLEESEIERIVASTKIGEDEEKGEDQIKVQFPYKTGDRVRVKEGYFQNHEGEVSAIDERNGRITVMINIFGRPNPVELDHWHVEFV